jgi:hypothetical protein
MFLDRPVRTPRSALTLIALASLFMASVGNLSLWQTLMALPDNTGWRGLGFGLAFGLMIASTVAALMASARSRAPVLIEPEPFDQDGQRVICYPGDPRHSKDVPVWPGPTRLTFRNRRFEPEGGLAALMPRD